MLDTMLVQRLRTVVAKRTIKLESMQKDKTDMTYIHGYTAGMEDTINDVLLALKDHVALTRKE